MAGPFLRSLFNTTLSLQKQNVTVVRPINTGSIYYAARKGTRAKARAKKVKVEITKVGFIPHNQRGKDKVAKVNVNKHADDSFKKISMDDVFPMRYYQWVVYSAEDAVKAHQETHHPTMYNEPNAYVYAQVEINMEAAKKNRFVENVQRLALLPHYFPRDEERTILAFCKGPELIQQVAEAGATTVGSTELVKKIQEGEVKFSDYDYVIAHPNILTDLVPIRGLMKRRFPNVRSGTLDANICDLVKRFAAGIHYKVITDEHQKNYGFTEVPIGRLNMDAKHIAENIDALLKDIQSVRPKRDGPFITRCFIVSPPSTEKLKIDPFVHVDKTLSKEVQEDSDDEEEAVAAKA
ncbi:50S ribosomal protein L1 [Bicyclus anynana]|uniref:50S ribosomal protein L1 n=1 Tax=Bicyclus anynana TaxID=110368 RepID=A0A6J1N3N6_BICAN|nr:50S ribosomal protein L1 [Bicyclus anynana]